MHNLCKRHACARGQPRKKNGDRFTFDEAAVEILITGNVIMQKIS